MTRRVIRWAAILLVVVVAAAAAGLIVVTTPWFKDRLRGFVVSQAAASLNGDLEIGALSGSLWRDVTLHNISLTERGQPTLQIATVTARYDIIQMALGRMAIDSLDIVEPRVRAAEDREGWNLTRIVRTRDTGPSDAPRSFAIGRIDVRGGDVTIERPGQRTERIADLNFHGALTYATSDLSLSIEELTARDARTNLRIEEFAGNVSSTTAGVSVRDVRLRTTSNHLTGHIAFVGAGDDRPEIDARVQLERFAAHELTAYLPAVPAALTATGRLEARGPLDALQASWELRSSAGNTDGAVTVNARARGRASGRVRIERLNLAALTGRRDLSSRLTAAATFDGLVDVSEPARSQITFAVDAPQIAMMDIRVEQLKASGTFDETGLRSSGRASAWGASASFDVRTAPLLSRSGRAVGLPALGATGRVDRLNVARLPARFSAPDLSTDFSGTYDLRVDGANWRADVVADESTVAGAVIAPGTILTAEVANGHLYATADGRVRNVRGGLLRLPEDAPTNLAGAVKAEVSIADINRPITLDAIEGRAVIDLDSSTVRGAAIDRASVDASLTNGLLTVRQLAISGASATVNASGVVAVTDEAGYPSNLTYQVEAEDLAALAAFGAPALKGTLSIDGVVTGPWNDLSTTGTFATRQLAYGETANALVMNGDFTAALPDRDISRLTAAVNGESTFVTVRNVEIQRLKFASKYTGTEVDLQATIEQPERTLTLDGGLLLHPDHREVHLRTLTLAGLGEPWSLAGERETVLRYGGDVLTVDGLTFVRGAERIEAQGRASLKPAAGDSDLTLRLANINVGDVYALAAGQPRVTGTAAGEFVLRGDLTSPIVHGQLTVTDGRVVDVAYSRAQAKVDLEGQRLTLDARIDEPTGATFSVTGSAPIAAEAGPLDLHVETSQISMGLVQAFTTALDNVQGVAAVNLHVTGELAAPSLAGIVTVSNGSFVVVPTGVAYQQLNADVRLEGQRAAIGAFSLADDDGHVLALKGGADIFAANGARAFDVEIETSAFSVLNNELGEAEVSATLRAEGQLTAPRITGRIHLNEGRLEVDELLRRLTAGSRAPYDRIADEDAAGQMERAAETGEGAETPAAQAAARDRAARADAAAAQTPAPDEGLFSRTAMDVTLVIPDDLVLRGRDLRAGPSAMGLGDLNLTIGGDLELRKTPGAEPVVIGDLQAVRGFYDFQGRRFEVVRGSSVIFRGADLSNPSLDVTGEREVSGIVARVRVSGTLRRPTLVLSSQPPLDEGDVLALIVFNQPMSQLGESEQVDLLERATDLAAGALASTLSESIGSALDVDLFEIRAPGSSGAGQVNIGRQVNDRLFVGFRQEFGDTDASRLSFEYRVTEALRILTSVAQGVNRTKRARDAEAAGVDLVFRLRY